MLQKCSYMMKKLRREWLLLRCPFNFFCPLYTDVCANRFSVFRCLSTCFKKKCPLLYASNLMGMPLNSAKDTCKFKQVSNFIYTSRAPLVYEAFNCIVFVGNAAEGSKLCLHLHVCRRTWIRGVAWSGDFMFVAVPLSVVLCISRYEEKVPTCCVECALPTVLTL